MKKQPLIRGCSRCYASYIYEYSEKNVCIHPDSPRIDNNDPPEVDEYWIAGFPVFCPLEDAEEDEQKQNADLIKLLRYVRPLIERQQAHAQECNICRSELSEPTTMINILNDLLAKEEQKP